jgi:hypothetical protein
MLESTSMADSLGLVVRDSNGRIKTTRYIKPHAWGDTEFIPNKFYLSLINSGHIQPNTWKIPFLFGSWTVKKRQ